MFKNMKLGTKIAGGFAIVLILTAVVGYVGFSGLGGVVTIVDKADDGNRFIKWALACRRDEKNYIMKGDSEYVGKVDNTVDQIMALAQDIESRFNQEKNKKQAQRILAAAIKYKKNFGDFVKLTGDQAKADADMVAAARKVHELCEESRAGQKTKMEAPHQCRTL